MRRIAFILGTTASIVLASNAFAQKSKDTIRIGIHQPVSSIDGIYDPSPQTVMMSRMVFDQLIFFNPVTKSYLPGVAESWKRIDGKTMEFKLRKDVRFHNGDAVDADDVAYTINFLLDPTTRIRFKDATYGWIKGVEKVDQYTVRVIAKDDFAPFEARMTTGLPVFPSKVHSKLADKSAFGRTPIGTGPYRAISVTPTRVVFERFEGYKLANAAKPAAKIKHVELQSITDEQTRLAKIMVGDLDLIYDVTPDVAENFKANPQVQVTSRPSNAFAYLMLDAVGRSGINYFKDKRVREAIMRSIDRKALVNALQPKEIAAMPLQKSMCHPWNIGCSQSTEPPGYDPALAKKLLAEAGYPNGFKFTIGTWGAARPAAEALAGQLRRIGLAVSLDTMQLPAFIRKRSAGELNAYAVIWDNAVGAPDVENTAGFFYAKGDRNYNGDEELTKLFFEGQRVFDPAKRIEIYRRMFDKVNSERYSMPLIPLAATLIHSSDLKIPPPGATYTEGFTINLLEWK